MKRKGLAALSEACDNHEMLNIASLVIGVIRLMLGGGII